MVLIDIQNHGMTKKLLKVQLLDCFLDLNFYKCQKILDIAKIHSHALQSLWQTVGGLSFIFLILAFLYFHPCQALHIFLSISA